MTADIDALFPAHLAAMQQRATSALQASGQSALVVAAGLAQYRYADDQTYPYVASAHFRAWVPLVDAPGSFVVYVPGRRPSLLFHQPEDYWHLPPALPTAAWLTEFEVRTIRAPLEARAAVPPDAALVAEPFPGCDDWGFAALNPPALLAQLDYARAVKTPYEIACLRAASLRGARAHRAAASAFATGASEYEIHLEYLRAAGHIEAELPYQNIIALNESGAVLHYGALGRTRPTVRRSLLIDAGAQFRGYACDITRTHAAARGDFADLVAGVERLQQSLCALVVPGAHYPDIHLEAHRLLGALLAEARIVSCSAATAVESSLTSVFFPHGIGHLLGLQVHDVGGHMAAPHGGELARPPGHPYLRLTRRLAEGMVVTIEPGLYFIDLLLEQARRDGRGRDIDWHTVEALRPYGGIRIEDDVVATPAGAGNLTRDAFAALDA